MPCPRFANSALELGHHCAATAALAHESGGPEAALWSLWSGLRVHMGYMLLCGWVSPDIFTYLKMMAVDFHACIKRCVHMDISICKSTII